jgi:hypothetical protein
LYDFYSNILSAGLSGSGECFMRVNQRFGPTFILLPFKVFRESANPEQPVKPFFSVPDQANLLPC